MTAVEWLGFATGVVLVLATAVSVLETTIVPRGSRSGLTPLVLRLVNLPVRLVASRVRDYERRDRLLAYASAAYLAATLLVWLLLFLAGYALMLWPSSASFGDALRTAGSSMLTLGIAVPHGTVSTVVVYLAAVTGLFVVALQIAYLPVLYAAFNRRETLVTMLEGLAGTPGWGPEILLRSASIDNLEGLGEMYDRWMQWAADVSESHSAYMILMYFRSPTSRRSWVISLLSILDAAAMHLALCPVTAPGPARNLMRVGYLAFRQLAATNGHPVPDDPSPDDDIQLTRDDFITAARRAQEGGMEFERAPETAWIHFKGWRVNYEAAAYALAASLDAVPALWSGPRPRPGPPVPPVRPVDRVSPSAEVSEIRRVGALRRERRAQLLRRQHHEHPDVPPTALDESDDE
ncbi:MAG TPA: hypothetical protein VG520_02900 [Candidatus Dormibacteraeota bacterium]|nr:hypothetical protein [Candidatus Dormibacteraeota bacterium]